MSIGLHRWSNGRVERHLLFFSVLLAVACLAYIPYTPRPIVPDIPAVVIPLAISVGLVVFTLRGRLTADEDGRAEQIVGSAWIGLLVSAGIGGWWLAIHVYTDLPVAGVVDEVLTVVSVGIGSGVVVGNLLHQYHDSTRQREAVMRVQWDEDPSDRRRVLEERLWTGRQSDIPVVEAVVETLADVEGIDPMEVGPLNDYVNPEAFAELRKQDGAPWQLAFYTDRYEIRVSSMGTVTVYAAERPTVHQ